MRPIPNEVKTILNKQTMVGQNKFNYEVDIEGEVEYLNPVSFTPVYIAGDHASTGNRWGGGNFITRPDGKVVVTYSENHNIMVSIVESEEILLTTPRVAENTAYVVHTTSSRVGTGGYMMTMLQQTNDGSLLLYILDKSQPTAVGTTRDPFEILCFESESRTGTDFRFKSYIHQYAIPNTASHRGSYGSLGLPVQLPSGRLMLPVQLTTLYSASDPGYLRPITGVKYSDDNGQTWNFTPISGSYWNNRISGITYFENNGVTQIALIQSIYYARGTTSTWLSDDEGLTYTEYVWPYTAIGEGVVSGMFSGGDGYNYMLHNGGGQTKYKIYKRRSDQPFTPEDCISTIGWTLITPDSYVGDDGNECLFISAGGYMIVTGTTYFGGGSVSYLYGAKLEIDSEASESKKIRPMSLNISRQKGMAGNLKMVINNKDGVANPYMDGSPNKGLLTTNRKVTVKQGYGDNLIHTFTGYVDSIEMGTFPQLLSMDLRDGLKKAFDQTISSRSGSQTVRFTNQSIDSIFKSLCDLGKMTYGVVEPTGISLSDIEFTRESYGDAFQKLADLASFEYGADEYGNLYFIRDYQPSSPSIAYAFEEGKDITSLSLQISDNDLYSRVVVQGKGNENGSALSAEAIFPGAREFNIFPQKILYIDASESESQNELQLIANRAVYLMQSKAKVLDFASIGIPWLQVGDFISVKETSSGVNNVYRITSLSSDMDGSSYTMQITAYYHGGANNV